MTQKLKIFSFFSGSGFLDLGFEKTGYEIEFVNEFFPAFIKAYKYSREKMGLRKPKYGYFNTDINGYLEDSKEELIEYIKDAKKDGSLIGFIGGPPCPDFSVAGKNSGKHGDNGKLSLSYINLIIKMKPDYFLFENVKGLWKTAKHRAFYEELKVMLHKVGYCTTERLTNAYEFGVPQDRARIFLIGFKSELLPEKYKNNNSIENFQWEKYIKYDLKGLKGLKWEQTRPFKENSEMDCPDNIEKELTVEYWFKKNNVENHLNSQKCFKPRNGLKRMQTVDEGDVSRKSYKRLHRWRYSPTVAYGNNEVHLHPYKARRLSVAEALAIQSLPAEFSLPDEMTLSDMFKTIGNGVPLLLSEGIAKIIKDFLEVVEDEKNNGL